MSTHSSTATATGNTPDLTVGPRSSSSENSRCNRDHEKTASTDSLTGDGKAMSVSSHSCDDTNSNNRSDRSNGSNDDDNGSTDEADEEAATEDLFGGLDSFEAKCCPAFWLDNGVPDLPIPCLGPILRWVFNPANKWLNDNEKAKAFGRIGHPWFHRNRRPLFSVALFLTLVALGVTAFGCSSLGTATSVVETSYWGYCSFKAPVNLTTIDEEEEEEDSATSSLSSSTSATTDHHGVEVFLGLRAVVARRCRVTKKKKKKTTTTSSSSSSTSSSSSSSSSSVEKWEHCHLSEESGPWTEVQCGAGDDDNDNDDDGGGESGGVEKDDDTDTYDDDRADDRFQLEVGTRLKRMISTFSMGFKGHGGGGETLLGFPCEDIERCKAQATGIQLGAFATCATLLFALVGVLTRIRWRADTNWQKVIGCLPDTFGAISLGFSLFQFANGCGGKMPSQIVYGGVGQAVSVRYWAGPGFYAYVYCWVIQVLRVSLHWLTPVPPGNNNSFSSSSRMGGAAMGYDQARGSINVAGVELSNLSNPPRRRTKLEPPSSSLTSSTFSSPPSSMSSHLSLPSTSEITSAMA